MELVGQDGMAGGDVRRAALELDDRAERSERLAENLAESMIQAGETNAALHPHAPQGGLKEVVEPVYDRASTPAIVPWRTSRRWAEASTPSRAGESSLVVMIT